MFKREPYKRVLKLGEPKKNIFNVGCPRIDVVKEEITKKSNLEKLKKFINSNGVGDKIRLK